MVALDKRGYLLLGSCKWWRKPVGEQVLDELYMARAALGPKAARARLLIFARNGFVGSLDDRAAQEGVTLVQAADLF